CLREVALAIGLDRKREELIVDVPGFPVLFPVDEEEGLVVAVVDFGNHDGAAKSKSVVVAARQTPDQSVVAVVGERLAGVKRFVDEVVISGAMKLIGARFHGQVEKA